ncbi:MAG: YitT family protein [Lachnospiraceae bacterium]|nr:YitT family protein [Lachnospiraceae bacterium]
MDSDIEEEQNFSNYLKKLSLIVLGNTIIAFTFINIHQQVNMTEGGLLGLVSVINHWFGIPSYLIVPILNVLFYAIAAKFLGIRFIKVSIVSTIVLTVFLRIFEHMPRILPYMGQRPLMAAILGGTIVGIGCGIIVRQGGSSGGDDALALTLTKISGWRIAVIYFLLDFVVLLLVLTYIPPQRIVFSLITALCSSILLDLVTKINRSRCQRFGKTAICRYRTSLRKVKRRACITIAAFLYR